MLKSFREVRIGMDARVKSWHDERETGKLQ